MTANARKIHDAQMASSQALPHIASIDTIPFYFSKDKSPDGDFSYRSNAESFLLIGEAMGNGMLELLRGK